MEFTSKQELAQISISGQEFQFELQYQQDSLFFSIKNQKNYLKDASSAIFLSDGIKVPEILLPKLLSTDDFQPKLESFTDQIGSGFQISLSCIFVSDVNEQIRISALWKSKVYLPTQEGLDPLISIQIILEDWVEDGQNCNLFGYAPIYMNRKGNLRLNNSERASDPTKITFYSNGWQSWSLNNLLGYQDKSEHAPLEVIRINIENQDRLMKGRFESEFHTVITDINSRTSLVLGFITLKDQFSRILMDRLEPDSCVSWLCAYSQTDGIPLSQLNEGLRQSEILMVSLTATPNSYETLREICRIAGDLAQVKLPESALAGWCSWYYYYTKISENEMLTNLSFFKDHPEIPIHLVQLDDGYQTQISDWGIEEPHVFNAKFPHGLQWLVDEIHSGSFRAGLWFAPFFTNTKAHFFANHPDWVLYDVNHKPVKTTLNWGHWQYGLDLSQDAVIEHVENMSRTITQKWGFDFLKIDFIFASEAIAAQYKNKTYTRAQILRRGVEAIRKGMGSEKYLLGCGAPLGPCIGLVDAMRIGTDTAAYWTKGEFLSHLGKVAIPGLFYTLRDTVQRSYMHKTLWINDPDCVIVRRDKSTLTQEEVLLQLTIFGLSAGQIMISDDMVKVDPDRLDLFKRLLPAYNSTAAPLDLFIHPLPLIYSLTTKESIGIRHLVAIINWENKPQSNKFSIKDLISIKDARGYGDDQQFLVFDYWRQEILGFFTFVSTVAIENQIPHSCRYLILIPLENPSVSSPIFVSSTLHILQGTIEIQEFEITETTISIMIANLTPRKGDLFIYLPCFDPTVTNEIDMQQIQCLEGTLVKIPITINGSESLRYIIKYRN